MHKVTDKDIKDFCELTGDNNPLHMDKNHAAKANFKERIVHGVIYSEV